MTAFTPASVQSARVSGPQWKVMLLVVLLVAADFMAGPQIQFGFFHVVPVMLAAWYHGAWLGIAVAVVMTATRFTFHWMWDFPMALVPTVINSGIRLVILSGVGGVCAAMSHYVRGLRARITRLEGQLPVCVSCGVIRREDGSWVEVSSLPPPSKHLLCPRCEERHYGSGV